MKRLLAIAALLIALSYGCTNQPENKEKSKVYDTLKTTIPPTSGLSQQDSIKAAGTQILTFLKNKNYPELIKYFSSDGVLFSPYGFIDTANSKKLSPEDFLESINKKWVLTWGSFDGTGDPIKLTVTGYLKKFVYNADYLNAEAVGFDEIMKQGNSNNNLAEVYPNYHYMDYHFSGFEQKNKGMDWTSLRLIFEKENGQYFLVAIIHDQWTV